MIFYSNGKKKKDIPPSNQLFPWIFAVPPYTNIILCVTDIIIGACSFLILNSSTRHMSRLTTRRSIGGTYPKPKATSNWLASFIVLLLFFIYFLMILKL
jgi:hypothetical protein